MGRHFWGFTWCSVAVLVGLVGCATRGEVDDEEAAQSALERSTREWAQELCAAIDDCDCGGGSFDVGLCVDRALTLQREEWDKGELDAAGIDEDCLQRRLDAIGELSCEQLSNADSGLDSDLQRLFGDISCHVYDGDAPVGTTCERSSLTSPCEDGAHCDHPPVSEDGITGNYACVPSPREVPEGSACGSEHWPDVCSPESVCDDFESGTCVRVGPGDRCVAKDCGVAADGRRTWCNDATDVCEVLPDLGEPCHQRGCGIGLCNQGTCVDQSWPVTCMLGDEFGLLQGG